MGAPSAIARQMRGHVHARLDGQRHGAREPRVDLQQARQAVPVGTYLDVRDPAEPDACARRRDRAR